MCSLDILAPNLGISVLFSVSQLSAGVLGHGEGLLVVQMTYGAGVRDPKLSAERASLR